MNYSGAKSNYRPKRDRGSRRQDSELIAPERKITGSKGKGGVGAPLSPISSDGGGGITRPRRIITDTEELGGVGGGVRNYAAPMRNYRAKRERVRRL